jgi:RNA polymerase sigma-70 factor (ECF subfamily)
MMTSAQPRWVEQSLELSDEEVVNRVRAGDLALYEILMRRYNQRLYRTVRAILREENEIEDILQETYLAAYRNLAEFEERSLFSTWLVRIAVNKALDHLRRRSKVVSLDPKAREGHLTENVALFNWNSPSEDPELRSARRELARLLEQAIDVLPALFRGVYVLREVEGMSTHETAECLGLELNTVKTRLHRARSLLREHLVLTLALDMNAAPLEVFSFGARRCDRLVAAVLDRLARGAR